MSRSALERQATRAARSGTLPAPTSAPAGFLSSVDDHLAEEQRLEEEVRSNVLPLHGNDRTFNLNTLLAQTILSSEYFKGLAAITTHLEVLDEIYSYCDHVAPWAPGTSRVPSSAFCLLMKLFVMKLTRPQMNEILVHEDSPFIRAVGFLYLRYTCPPKELWGWLEPYVDDEEEFKPSPTESSMTMGAYVRKIISDMQYYGTMLPRIPVLIERKMKVQLLLHEEMKKREKANFRIVNQLVPGTKIRAIYADEDNDPSWYDAVINSVEDDKSYWVTFPEYGNTELVRLGSIMLQAKTDNSPARGGGGGGDHGSTGGNGAGKKAVAEDDMSSSLLDMDTSKLYAQVMKREREASEAVGKDYAARPASYKGSLSLKLDRYTQRRKSRSRSPERPRHSGGGGGGGGSGSGSGRGDRRKEASPPRRKAPVVTAEELRRQQDLKKRYGDASASRR